MKTKEELNALKNEVEELNKKLTELTEDELKSVTGGSVSVAKYGLFPGDPCPRQDGGILVKDENAHHPAQILGGNITPRIVQSVCPVCHFPCMGTELIDTSENWYNAFLPNPD